MITDSKTYNEYKSAQQKALNSERKLLKQINDLKTLDINREEAREASKANKTKIEDDAAQKALDLLEIVMDIYAKEITAINTYRMQAYFTNNHNAFFTTSTESRFQMMNMWYSNLQSWKTIMDGFEAVELDKEKLCALIDDYIPTFYQIISIDSDASYFVEYFKKEREKYFQHTYKKIKELMTDNELIAYIKNSKPKMSYMYMNNKHILCVDDELYSTTKIGTMKNVISYLGKINHDYAGLLAEVKSKPKSNLTAEAKKQQPKSEKEDSDMIIEEPNLEDKSAKKSLQESIDSESSDDIDIEDDARQQAEKAINKARRAHNTYDTENIDNKLKDNLPVEVIHRRHGQRHELYQTYVANHIFLPKITSSAITDQAMILLQHPKFIIIFEKDLENINKNRQPLLYSIDYCFELLQRLLHHKYKKILPYENTPNKSYVETVLAVHDPDDSLKLRRTQLDLVEIEQQYILVRNNKELKQRDKQGFKISAKAFAKYYRLIEKTMARSIAYQCSFSQKIKQLTSLQNKILEFSLLHTPANQIVWDSSELKYLSQALDTYIKCRENIDIAITRRILNKFASENTIDEVLDLMKELYPEPLILYQSKIQKIIAPDEVTKESVQKIDFKAIYDVYKSPGLKHFVDLVRNFVQTDAQTKQLLEIKNMLISKENERFQKLYDNLTEALAEIDQNKAYLAQYGISYDEVTKAITYYISKLKADTGAALRMQIDKEFFKIRKQLMKAYSFGKKHDDTMIKDTLLLIGEFEQQTGKGHAIELKKFKIMQQKEKAVSKISGESLRRTARMTATNLNTKQATADKKEEKEKSHHNLLSERVDLGSFADAFDSNIEQKNKIPNRPDIKDVAAAIDNIEKSRKNTLNLLPTLTLSRAADDIYRPKETEDVDKVDDEESEHTAK